MRYILLFFTVIIISTLYSVSCDSYSPTVSSIIVDLYYNLDTNTGYVNQTVVFGKEGSFRTVVIPLLKPPEKGQYDVISIVNDQGIELFFQVNENATITVYTNNSKIVKIDYVIYNYADELAPGLYVFYMDLMEYSITEYIQVSILLSGDYKVVDIEPTEGVSYKALNGNLEIVINKPLVYFIALSLITLSENNTTSTGGGQIPCINGSALLIPALAIVAIIAIAGTVYYIISRRRGIEVEELPPSVLEDETSKKIIELTGDSGEEGIRQSKLVSLTGRPKSSISRRIRRLAEEGYVEIIRKGKFNIIRLTSKGFEVYKDIKKRKS